jgi:hypothetical protein
MIWFCLKNKTFEEKIFYQKKGLTRERNIN